VRLFFPLLFLLTQSSSSSEGVEFAIQTLSRFALTYLLTTHNTLAPNAVVMSICNTGQNLDGLDVKDLSLKGKRYQGKYKASLALDQSKRDSTVLDAFFEVGFAASS